MIEPDFASEPRPPVVAKGFWKAYRPGGAYDEMMGPDGEPRAHWREFVQAIRALGETELARRWQNGLRLIHENGITYNVYGDPSGLERPWQLDPIPLLLPEKEWRVLEAGVIQRATLLNMFLADMYGPQKLLTSGALPAGVVFGHPMFLRPCFGVTPPGGTYLHVYAVDLARAPSGQWWVVNDRTQAPSGFGYACENRVVISRVLPEIFHECRAERLAAFTKKFRQGLRMMSPRKVEHPRVMLLTPGPYNETYFEHSYMARLLGCTLVEGEDLTVRENSVYHKTLSGLNPVDVILRRLDEDFSDPLEFRSDSSLGVAGLFGATAAHRVAVANAFGSGLVETPALRAFLGPLCRHLLGADLLLPNVATWWCGQPGPMEYVLNHLDHLRVLPVNATRGTAFFTEPVLTAQERAELASRIRFRPQLYAAHERIVPSTTPTLEEDGSLVPRPTLLRVFLIAHQDSYLVFPGGLARVAPAALASQAPAFLPALLRGPGSKDTWIIRDSPIDEPPSAAAAQPSIELRRGKTDISSRVADNLFWLGRYTERFEGMVRLFRTILDWLAEGSVFDATTAVRRLIKVPIALGYVQALKPSTTARATFAAIESELLASIFDAQRPTGLRAVLTCLHRLAGSTRDRMSPDVWRILNHLADEMAHPSRRAGIQLGETVALLNQMLLTLAAFSGIEAENTTRALDWRFLNMGRRLERAMHTMRIFRELLIKVEDDEALLLEILLDLHDSSITYRSRYFGGIHIVCVVDLLLMDESNPRSVGFQLAAIADHLLHLPRDADETLLSGERKLLLRAQSQLRLADPGILASTVADGRRTALGTLLSDLASTLPQFSDSLTLHYFSHAPAVSEEMASP
jgi:uncharacterized circularly permuted ATP-grasp superfamily protein/uncharacterized alpha-E superfamily protein